MNRNEEDLSNVLKGNKMEEYSDDLVDGFPLAAMHLWQGWDANSRDFHLP